DTWKFRYEITMKQNPMYWGRDALKIKRVVWLEVQQYYQTMQLYRTAEIDYLGDNMTPPAEQLDFLSTKKDYHQGRYLATSWFEFNTKKPPVDDARVRWALNL